MGKVISILLGLVLIAAGVLAIVFGESWRDAVLVFIQGGVVIMVIVVGLGIFVFGISELRAGAEEPPIVEPQPSAAAPETPGAEESSAGSPESTDST